MTMSNGIPECSRCIRAASASTDVPTRTPRCGVPGLKGPSNLTPNHSPNSRESVMARQTRARGARRRIFFSIRSVTACCDICNLAVAILQQPDLIMQPTGCLMTTPAVFGQPQSGSRHLGTRNPTPAPTNHSLVRVVQATDGYESVRSAPGVSRAPPQPALCKRRDCVAGARYRREHGHLHADRSNPAAEAARGGARVAGHALPAGHQHGQQYGRPDALVPALSGPSAEG